MPMKEKGVGVYLTIAKQDSTRECYRSLKPRALSDPETNGEGA